MVGGRIIDVSEVRAGEVRLWCIGTGCESRDECAVHVALESEMPKVGDMIWWQGRTVFWDGDRRQLRRIGYSYDPRRVEAIPDAKVTRIRGRTLRAGAPDDAA